MLFLCHLCIYLKSKVKNIKKPPAAKPGFVIYNTYNTAYVRAVEPVKNTKEDKND